MKIYRNVFFLFIIFSLFVYLPIGCGSGGGDKNDKSQYVDADSDGVEDTLDHCLSTPAGENVDSQGCSDSQKDSDYDGIPDSEDLCTGEDDTLDHDKDGVPNCIDECIDTEYGEAVQKDGCSATQRVSEIIGPEGGSIKFNSPLKNINNFKVNFSKDVLSDDTKITLTNNARLPEDYPNINNSFISIEIEPKGLVFDSPVSLFIDYKDIDNDGIVDGTSISEENLLVFISNQNIATIWEPLTIISQNTEINQIEVQTKHFSNVQVSDSAMIKYSNISECGVPKYERYFDKYGISNPTCREIRDLHTYFMKPYQELQAQKSIYEKRLDNSLTANDWITQAISVTGHLSSAIELGLTPTNSLSFPADVISTLETNTLAFATNMSVEEGETSEQIASLWINLGNCFIFEIYQAVPCADDLFYESLSTITRFLATFQVYKFNKRLNEINIADEFLRLFYITGGSLSEMAKILSVEQNSIIEAIADYAVLYDAFVLPDYNKDEVVGWIERSQEAVSLLNSQIDADNDGIVNSIDICPTIYNPDQKDSDEDGIGDVCDNCIEIKNPEQIDEDNDSFGKACDCEDLDSNIKPGETELCDGKDNDCNGSVDDGFEYKTYGRDADYDYYGDPNDSYYGCPGRLNFVDNIEDCDDNNSNKNPGETEIPYDDIDQDCNGSDLTDVDSDGYNAIIVGGGDCNDNNPDINPGLDEICGNDVDENCDGIVEECPVDSDSDGVLDSNDDCPNTPIGESVDTHGCSLSQTDDDEDGFNEIEGDCNDSNPEISPGLNEICGNDIDENCDGIVEECPVDGDDDGFSENQGDCNDYDETVYPGALEIVSDDIDHDCDEDPRPDDYSTVKVTVVHSEALLPNEDTKCFIKYNDVIFSEESTDEFGQCEFKISTKNVDTQEKISILVQDSNYNDNEVILDASLSSEIYKRVPLVHLNQKIPGVDDHDNNDCDENKSGPFSIYYVDDVNGNDDNDGSLECKAWQSLWKVNHAELNPGDIVRFKRGGIWRGTLRTQSGSLIGNYITYTDYGDETLPKPQFIGSINKSFPDDWEFKEGYIWKSRPLQLDGNEIMPNVGFDYNSQDSWKKCKFIDSDGDGVDDLSDTCPDTQSGESVDENGCADEQIESGVDDEAICDTEIDFHCTDLSPCSDCDANDWYIWGTNKDGDAARVVCGYIEDGELILKRLENEGETEWGSIQLWNTKAENPIQFGKYYMLSFDAYCSDCDEGMSIDSIQLIKKDSIGKDKDGNDIHPKFYSSSSISSFNITGDYKTYKVIFKTECMDTCENCGCESGCIDSFADQARVNFYLGEDFPEGVSFHIDNISMHEVTNDKFLFQDVGNLIFTDLQECGVKRFNYEELKENKDFWFDNENMELNIVSIKDGVDNPSSELNNPANNFQTIECAILDALVDIDPGTPIKDDRVSYVIVKNFDLKYAGGHGIKGNRTDHISIQNCDISYIGGKILPFGDNLYPAQTVRYGNGIEIWDIGTDWYIGGNKIWQIYDACITAQGDGVRFKDKNIPLDYDQNSTDLRNIFIQNNVLANSEYGFEFWDKLEKRLYINENIFFENNSVLFSGYSWAYNQRFRNPDLAECWPKECFDCSNGAALYNDCIDNRTSTECTTKLAFDSCKDDPYSDECLSLIADNCQDPHGRHFNAWNNYASTGNVSIKNNLFYQAQDVAIYFHDIWYGQENIDFDYNMYCQYDDDLETETNLVKILFNDITLYGLNEFYEYQQDTEWDAHSYNCSLPEICDDNPMLSAPDQIKDSEYGFVGFEDEYQILSGSKCIDTGSNDIKNFSGKDVDGNDRDIQNIDIGAFEYQGF